MTFPAIPHNYLDMYLITRRGIASEELCFLFKEPFQKEARKIIWDLKKNVPFGLKGYSHSYFIISNDPALSRVLTHTTCRLIRTRENSSKIIQSFFRRYLAAATLHNISLVSRKCHEFYTFAPSDVLGEIKKFF